MEPSPITQKTVCIVGLGYVGLPLAEAFSHRVKTLGFDIDQQKILRIQHSATAVLATADPVRIGDADFIMICVPTLLTRENEPDLSFVRNAAAVVGAHMKKGATVILESTVFPGVTEEVLLPVLEKESGWKAGRDFRVGYSPERINPGDDEHVLAKTTKIVAGMDTETTDAMAELYSLITKVYRAPGIRTAEAAKVVENIQRDVNIALINEFSQMFARMNLNTRDVLDAAGTKWNFHPYTPGIVGGHCIPTVPYFLAYAAKRVGYMPKMILAGRATNDFMTKFIADLVVSNLKSAGKKIPGSRIAILGLTYKENVPDYRDNPVVEIVRYLREPGIEVFGYDPLLTPEEIARMGVEKMADLSEQMDGYILAAPHRQFLQMHREFSAVAGPTVLFIDIKGVFHNDDRMKALFNYLTL